MGGGGERKKEGGRVHRKGENCWGVLGLGLQLKGVTYHTAGERAGKE